MTRRTIIKLTPIIRILIQITKPTIVSRVIRRRERNRRKSTTRSRPPTLNRRPLRIKIRILIIGASFVTVLLVTLILLLPI